MFAKFVVIACALAAANAGIIGAPAYATSYAAPLVHQQYASYEAPSVAATSQNVYRSAGNLNTVSTFSKSVATPFSSSNKMVTSITNPGVYAQVHHAAPVVHQTYAAAPVVQQTYAAAAPVAAYHSAPVAHAAPAHIAYSPAIGASHVSFSSPIGINYGW